MVNEKFKKWALGFSGCDGGDIGSATSPSVWLCGIEWGGEYKNNEFEESIKKDCDNESKGYEDCEINWAYQFNQKATKLLAALNGYEDCLKFYKDIKPFTKNSTGYFRLNLYPMAFRSTDKNLWNNKFADITGFETKDEYIKWIQENRFKEMRKWARTYKPKLIICVGITYRDDFIRAFGDSDTQVEQSNAGGKTFYYFKNQDGAMVVITYFLGGRWGLNSDKLLKQTGESIAKLTKG